MLNLFLVPSQKIKDALPKEIIESIRASSVHSRTIAIVEPVNRKLEIDKKSVSSFVKPEPSLGKPFGLTTRFQEAAVNLSRTNKVRQILMPTSLTSGNQVLLNTFSKLLLLESLSHLFYHF